MNGKALLDEHISIAKTAALEAGSILRTTFEEKTVAVTSSARDIKTQADLDAHNIISAALERTGYPVISEESNSVSINPSSETLWIVDPLDGTVNFFRGTPLNCTSIGFWSEGKPVFGIIYDFLADELVTGGPQFGAQCNGTDINVSGVTRPEEAIIATGFPNARNFNDAPLANFISQIQSFLKVRLLGSAALSLAWLAQGRLDAYYEEDIYLWDVAAGLAIVLGSGGAVEFTGIDLDSMKLKVHASSSPKLLKSFKC